MTSMNSAALVRSNFKWLTCLVLAGSVGCSDSETTAPPSPTPGMLTLQLITPNSADGAVRLVLDGPDIGLITAVQADAMVFTRSSGSQRSIAVLGTTVTGGLLRFEVPDVNQASRYQATLVEVAGVSGSELRSDLGGYELDVVR